jgi:EAL and modified HD-GYP domain-containing signal transduction protein
MSAAFVARHPIFNAKLEVVGYELLFRGRGYAGDAEIEDPSRATATVVLNALTELELQRVVGGKPAWINVSGEFVLDGLVRAIPPGLGGLEIAEDELVDDEVVDALRDLKRDGYRLALDNYQSRAGSERVRDLFDVVKLDMRRLGRDELRAQVERLRSHGVLLLGDKLGTRPDHEFCLGAGCHLFQGHFFCQPAVLGTRGISANRLTILQVVAELHRPDVELAAIEQLLTRDVSLSFRMLRYVNSAFFGLRHEVRSIGQALALLGLENVRRWATLSVLASIDGKPAELTVTALVRGRFCELAAEQLDAGVPAELFTLGLFSVLDAMMDAPMSDIVESLPLAEDLRDALVARKGIKGALLQTVRALEDADDSAPLVVSGAGELYLKSLIWANTAAEELFGGGTPARPGAESAGGTGAGAAVGGRARSDRPDPAAATPLPLTGAGTSAPGPVRRALRRCGAALRRVVRPR